MKKSAMASFDILACRLGPKERLSVGKDLETVLRKIEYWHQAPIITFSIMARNGGGAWHGVQWDGKTATPFPLNETDEKKAMQALLLKNPLEEAANASERGKASCRRADAGCGD